MGHAPEPAAGEAFSLGEGDRRLTTLPPRLDPLQPDFASPHRVAVSSQPLTRNHRSVQRIPMSLKCGAVACLAKPFDARSVLKLIRSSVRAKLRVWIHNMERAR